MKISTKRPSYIMSFQKPKALSAASSGITLQEVQVPSIQV